MHLTAQYLAAAGISFVAKKDDDSHTNVGFSIEKTCIETHKWFIENSRIHAPMIINSILSKNTIRNS